MHGSDGMLIRLLTRCGWFAGLGTATLLGALLVLAGPARAAFPGRDGLLAVQPLTGSGIVLVKANGRSQRRVCRAGGAQDGIACASAGPLKPDWAPDGRVLAVSGKAFQSPNGSTFSVIYPDGSCLACEPYPSPTADAAFTSNPTVFTAVGPFAGSSSPKTLLEFGIDGLMRKALVSGPVSDPVWSSRGELAVVRGGWIWVGRPGKLRRLIRGSAPSWSPHGSQIVFDRRGWLMIVGVRARSVRRVVRGTAPVWSPDGAWIAFFGNGHRLSVVPTSGGRVRRVGDVTGTTVDWQTLSTKRVAPCLTPSGSTVMARSAAAIVTAGTGLGAEDGILNVATNPYAYAYMGCLHADGRERLLASYQTNNYDDALRASAAVLAGNYAALVVNHSDAHYGGNGSTVELFDLRTGAGVPDRGGEFADCGHAIGGTPPQYTCETNSIDALVLGADAVSAAHTIVAGCSASPPDCATVEQIQASDSTGVHTLDSVTEPEGSPAALTNLTLIGNTLTWDHDGVPRSAQLQP